MRAPFGLLDLPCALLDSLWTRARPVGTSGAVSDQHCLICEPLLDRGSFVGFCGPVVKFWFDHCWTVFDFWVISSLGFLLELFMQCPHPCGLCISTLEG